MKNLFNRLFKIAPDYNKRVYGLDIMRALAIGLVLFAHAALFLRGYFSLEFYPFALSAYLGVEIFFVLSGFLIGTILIKMYEQSVSFTPKVMLKFWTRRWFRTLPAYYLVLIINIFIVCLGFGLKNFHGYDKDFNLFFVFLQGFANRNPPVFGEAWSLAIEEWFYLLLPILILFFSLLLGKFISKKSIILTTIIVFILVITGIRINYALQNPMSSWQLDIHMVTVYRLDAIMYGVLAAFVCYYYKNLWKRLIKFSKYAGAIVVIAGLILFMLTVQKQHKSFLADTFLFTVFSIGFALFLPLADSIKIKNNAGNFARLITHVSIVSYSVYLINYSIIFKFTSKFFKTTHFISGLIVYLLSLVVVLIAATLLYKFYEKPMTDLREKLSPTRKSLSPV
jgi:peptidoglycan/LPS O-acetylase OafA/YrhL